MKNLTQNQIDRIIRIATCKVNSGQYNASASHCGGGQTREEYFEMAERAEPNLDAEIDSEWVNDWFNSDGIRSAINAVITQMIYASPDMADFNHEGYSVEVSVK